MKDEASETWAQATMKKDTISEIQSLVADEVERLISKKANNYLDKLLQERKAFLDEVIKNTNNVSPGKKMQLIFNKSLIFICRVASVFHLLPTAWYYCKSNLSTNIIKN